MKTLPLILSVTLMGAFIIYSGINSESQSVRSDSSIKDDAIASSFASAIDSRSMFGKKKEPKYLYGPKRIHQPARFEIPSRQLTTDEDFNLIIE